MRDGYEVIGAADWAGIKSGPSKVAIFENGMLVLANHCAPPTEGYLPGKFIPPEVLQERAQKFLELIDGTSGFVRLGLRHMGNGYIAQPPGGTSFSMRIWGSEDEEHGFSRLFVPLSPGSYAEWVEHCVGSLRRKYPYEAN